MKKFLMPFLILLCVVQIGCLLGTASGRITIEGTNSGLEEVTVLCSGHTFTYSKSDGSWSMGGLQGQVLVTPQKDGWVFEPVNRQVRSNTSNVNFKATRQ